MVGFSFHAAFDYRRYGLGFTLIKGDKTVVETRFFISSLPLDVETFSRAVRGHWMVESYHWHLDVTFREDANQTLDKRAAYNLNIINKMAINVLKMMELSGMKPMSLKKKRYAISLNFEGFMRGIRRLDCFVSPLLLCLCCILVRLT